MELAFVGCTGPHMLAPSFQKLVTWAKENGLMNEKSKLLTIYHNSMLDTEEKDVALSACLTLSIKVNPSSGVGVKSIKAGRYIVARHSLNLSEFESGWKNTFAWMNENGFQKAPDDPFEIYHNNLLENPNQKAIVDFVIPVK